MYRRKFKLLILNVLEEKYSNLTDVRLGVYLGMDAREKAVLKDNILGVLVVANHPDITEIAKMVDCSNDQCFVACKDLSDDDYIKTREITFGGYNDNKMIWISPEGREFQESNSYLSILESELKSERYAQAIMAKPKITPQVISIGIAIILGLSTGVLGWLQYFDNKELKELRIENQKLIYQIDSLKKIIPNQNLIKKDSL